MISGFSYVHNALRVGIPIRESIRAVRPYVDEMVIVDASSTDGTRELLESMEEVDTVISHGWGNLAGETLAILHSLHTQCKGHTIVHFEADEVFSQELIENIFVDTSQGVPSLKIPRIQVEQNFQRVRWYPELVHRVFPKGSVKKVGHTTDKHLEANELPIEDCGLLWDVTNCFRDQFLARIDQQANLWNTEPNYKMVPVHFNHPVELTREQVEERLKEPHWSWRETPINIPDILKPLVGKTKYE